MKLLNKRGLNSINNILLFLFCAAVLTLSLRGIVGNPTDTTINNTTWKENGPLELSPERGRYALLYSLVENHSFALSSALARFATPDVAYTGNGYASLFAPSVSIIAIPGYMIGKHFGIAQVGSFAIIAFFALMNVFLLRGIATRLGAHRLAATIAGIAFIFASPAFTYAGTLYQHHISTFLILASVYLLVRYNTVLSLIIVWSLAAFSISVDYPNFFMMLPIGIFALGKTFLFERKENKMTIRIPVLKFLALFSVILPLAFFLWSNNMSYGSPFKLAGSFDRAIVVKSDGKPILEEEIKKAHKPLVEKNSDTQSPIVGFFWTRNMINGFYTLFLSLDRGMIMYTPVMLLGIIGIIIALCRKQSYVALLLAIMGFNIILYSMWGDPYGGWAFGSRYLIPTYAILGIFLAIALTHFKKYNLFLLLFFAVFSYSVGVNTLGAVTSSRNPPQVEALGLEQKSGKEEKYTYERNLEVLNKNQSKSFIYQTYFQSHLSAWEYYLDLSVFIIMVTALLIVLYKAQKEHSYAL
jgi:hypothetical protein